MIWHHRERQKAEVNALFGFGEDTDERAIVVGVNKQTVAPARSIENVMRYASRSFSLPPRH